MGFPETKGLKVTYLEIEMAVEEVDVTLTSFHVQTGITTEILSNQTELLTEDSPKIISLTTKEL